MNQWRLIFTGANDAFFNMALDEALLISCQNGTSPPVLRLYLWDPRAVSIGYFQAIEKTVDLGKCKDKGIDVVRRITGGRAVLHEDEITYSVCASSDYFPQLGENALQTYQRISLALLESLRLLGIDADWVKPTRDGRLSTTHMLSSKPCFVSSSRYEITVGGKKLIGSAQRRFSFRSSTIKKDSFIQHGSILMGNGEHSLAELLPEKKSVEIMKHNLKEKSTNLEKILKRKLKPEEMILTIKMGFEKIFETEMENSDISEQENKIAQSLRNEKYTSEGWNLQK